ncbi:MAG: hypothetical protein H0U30_04370 [Actinobacteria bacterium]|nr:hypothetical protein [Actinomycetota bacterium]
MRARVRDPRSRGTRALACETLLELNEEGGEGFEEWDLPSAEQGMAHAHLAAGDAEQASCWAELAREKLARVEDLEDRELIESQIGELGL